MPDMSLFGNVNWIGMLGKTAYWVGYGLVILIILGVFVGVAYISKFKFKVIEIPLVGSGTTDGLSVGKKKTNRFKWNKLKNGWKPLMPLFNKTEIEPFDPKYVYVGNTVYAFKLGETYIPGCISVSVGEDKKIQSEINPVPHYLRNWQATMHQKHAEEFAKHDFWTENRTLIMTAVVGGLILAACVGAMWLSYKFVGANQADAQAISNAIKGLVNKNVIS